METTRKATILREDERTCLIFHVMDRKNFQIVLTEDNPNNVKGVFNEFLKELKNGFFNFELDDEKRDLYHEICLEYLTQLNSELEAVYEELVVNNLIDTE